jgi:hypothetical protein
MKLKKKNSSAEGLMKSDRLCRMVQYEEDRECTYKSGGANCWKTATWKTKEL